MAFPVGVSLSRAALFVAVLIALQVQRDASAFPLPSPVRPTTYPLSRPTVAGEVVAWGDNQFGQCDVPASLTNAVFVTASSQNAAAITAEGSVIVWGNSSGATNVPAGLNDVVSIALSDRSCLALKSNGDVIGWGRLPDSTPLNLTKIVSVAIDWAGDYAVALAQDGTVIGWGNQGESSLNQNIKNAVMICVCSGEGSALLLSGSIVTWNAAGLIVKVVKTQDIASINGSFRNTYLRRDGTIPLDLLAPIDLKATAAQSGPAHTIALVQDGTVRVWVSASGNPYGVLNVPNRMRGVFSIATGANFCIAAKIPSRPIPSLAKAAAHIFGGIVTRIDVVDSGDGFIQPPKVTVNGGGGTGATAIAEISSEFITGFTMTDTGSGYSSVPTVEIEAPPGMPSVSTSISRISVTMNVVPGKRYQLQSSNDLPNFSNVGNSFVADAATRVQEFVVSETGQYFRLEELP